MKKHVVAYLHWKATYFFPFSSLNCLPKVKVDQWFPLNFLGDEQDLLFTTKGHMRQANTDCWTDRTSGNNSPQGQSHFIWSCSAPPGRWSTACKVPLLFLFFLNCVTLRFGIKKICMQISQVIFINLKLFCLVFIFML